MKGKTLAILAVLALVGTASAAVAVSYAPVSGTITLQTNSGVAVSTNTHGGGMALEQPFVSDTTVELITQNGNVTVSGSGQASLAVNGYATTGVTASEIATGTTVVTVTPATADTLQFNGSADSLSWDTVEADDGATDVSTTLSGSQAITLRFGGLSPNTDYRLLDSNDNAIAVGTTDGNGDLSLTVSQSADLRLAEYDNPLPTVTGLEPNGEVVSGTVTLNATVDDDSLPNQPVDVVFRVNGNVVETRTITSAGDEEYTLTQSELPSAGSHEWSVTATDSLGGETTATSSFGIPSNMTVRNVSDSSEVISGANVTFYLEDTAISRTTDANGNVSLEGLPGNERIPVEINATDYYARTTVIPSVVAAQDAYLLPRNETAVLNRFTLSDATGTFGSESFVYISRPVNISGSTSWERVAGDQVGVEGFPAQLEQDQRYRITIVSGSNMASLGKFIATQSEEVPLQPETVTVELGNGTQVGYNATVEDGTLTIQYADPDEQTGVLTLSVVNRFNDTDYLVEPTTYYGVSSLRVSEPVGQNGLNKSYVVQLEGQRDGDPFTIRMPIGPEQRVIVPPTLSLPWIQFAGIGMLLLVGGSFSRLNAGIGAVVTSLLAGIFWYIGLLQGVATWATVVVAITFSIIYAMVTR